MRFIKEFALFINNDEPVEIPKFLQQEYGVNDDYIVIPSNINTSDEPPPLPEETSLPPLDDDDDEVPF